MAERVIGTCKWFDRKKGYGFIEVEGREDVFVHQTEIKVDGFRALYPDQSIEFTITTSGPNARPCATNVTGEGGKILEASSNPSRRQQRSRGGANGNRQRRGKARALMNSAFVFIKPHAVTEETKALVKQVFEEKGIRVYKEGSLTSEEIDQKKLIDQHYYSIASKATMHTPDKLVVPNDKFEAQFDLSWSDALAGGRCFNAMDGCKELGIDGDQLNTLWAECKKAKKMVKLGGGFYCGLIEVPGKAPCYIFNGFFMSMRAKFTAPGQSIYYFAVEWDPNSMSWSDFRGKLLGPTDPTEAPADSLRGMVLAKWQELGLKSVPDVGDNGVHASASPFEALAERMNWLGIELGNDRFGKALNTAGVSEDTIDEWSVDPQVQMPDGSSSSLFDSLEDMDAKQCIEKCVSIVGA